MERDCLIGHGAVGLLKERMLDFSDNYRLYICTKCGLQGIVNPAKNIYMCGGCKGDTSFAEIRVPYAFKLFIQELQGMAITPRLRIGA